MRNETGSKSAAALIIDELRSRTKMPPDRVEPRELLSGETMHPPASRRAQRRVFRITAIVLLAVLAAFYAYHRFEAAQIKAHLAMPRPPTPITAAVAQTQSVPKFLSGIGTLQAVHQVTVSPEIGGRITEIFFEPGAAVNAGDPLVQLNDAPERGDLANYQAMKRLAGANLARDKALSARDYQSRQVVDQQQTLLDQAEANIAKTEAQIAQKLIRAPFTGQLGVRQVNLGGYVNPGGPIVTLTDLSTLWVNFTLPEQVSSQVHVGQAARIKADAYPGRLFQAKITAIEPQISAQTRTILVQATLENNDHALLPGMFANVDVVLPEMPEIITIPETAVDYSLYGDSVFVIREDGKDAEGKPVLKVTRAFVKTGDRFDGKVAILSGLKPGDRVAASGQLNLRNDIPVTILPGNALSVAPSTSGY
jgi:multidrug efflux system membrane fusion protein